MNINRNNYEEFFLLYADGELSQQERQQVETFTQLHPDLADELQVYMESKLTPDPNVSMPGKSSLLKLESWDADHLTPSQLMLLERLDKTGSQPDAQADISFTDESHQKEWEQLQKTLLEPGMVQMPNKAALIRLGVWDEKQLSPIQEKMMQQLEGNLPSAEHASLSALIAADPELQKEWQVLQSTVLPVDVVAMPRKEKLYRSETPVKAPVIRIMVTRWIAAAAVMTGIGWFVFNNLQPSLPSDQPIIAGTEIMQEGNVNSIQKSAEPSTENRQPAEAIAQNVLQPAVEGNQKQPAREILVKNDQPVQAAVTTPSPEKGVPTVTERPLPSLNEELTAKATDIESYDLLDNTGRLTNINDYAGPRAISTGNNNVVQQEEMIAYQASYSANDEDADDNIVIAGVRVPRQKVRGLIRTVSRNLGRNFEKGTVAPADESYTSNLK